MQNSEGNPSQAQQMEMAARSPAKTPATGSASPDASTLAKEFASTKDAMSTELPSVRNVTPLPPIDVGPETEDSPDPVARAASRIVSTDNAGMTSSDNTVDSDGKTAEARRDMSRWHDNVISSNATLENHVTTPAWGLGGFDSRTTGNLAAIAPRTGYRVVFLAAENFEGSHGSRVERMICFERIDVQPRIE